MLRAAAFASTLLAAPAAACDLCSIYTGTIMQEDRTGLYVGIAEQHTSFGTLQVDGHEVPNPENEWLRSSITQLVLGYAFHPRVALQVNVPLISREYRRIEEDGIARRGDEGGLGDIALVLRVVPVTRAYNHGVLHAELLAGMKVPSGDTDRLAEELEEDHDHAGTRPDGLPASAAVRAAEPPRKPHHEEHEEHASGVHGHDLALGSGSIDGSFGLVLYGSWKRLFFSAQAQYAVRGNGQFGYEYADDLLWAAGPGVYPLLGHEYTTALQLVVSGETKGNDTQRRTTLDDTAITSLFLGPGLSVTWSTRLSADFAADFPVILNNSGRQIVPDYRLRGGLTWHF